MQGIDAIKDKNQLEPYFLVFLVTDNKILDHIGLTLLPNGSVLCIQY